MFADVEYEGEVYLDTELIDGEWWCINHEDGVFQPFSVQADVIVHTSLQLQPKYYGDKVCPSGSKQRR